MREIKFRAWDTQLKTFLYSGFGGRTFSIFIKRVNCLRFLINQYTGLKDKNGKEIYEGDILKWIAWGYPGNEIESNEIFINKHGDLLHKVEWNDDGFNIPYTFEIQKYWEIIGNIHENPELIK